MVNNLKALILVLPILLGIFFVARFVFKDLVKPSRMDTWCGIFLSVTVIGFMIPNFWIMIMVLGLVLGLVVALRLEPNIPALFALVICALPPNERAIPGFGGINQIFPISPPLMMSIAILIAGIFFTQRFFQKTRGILTTDIFMGGFILLSMVLAFRDTSFTDGLRIIWILFLTVFLPYFVVSRWSKDFDEIKVICVALIVPLLCMAGIAFLESIFKWHFYAMPSANWHGPLASPYSYRSGFLRAYASVLGPIEFGFMLMIAMTLAYAVMSSRVSKLVSYGGLVGFAGALLLTFSRGPWLGAVISTGMYVISGPKGISRGVLLSIAGIIGLLILAVTPLGPKIFALLPFVGDVDADYSTVSYRQKLLENGLQVISEKPLFGSTTYYEHPKMIELVQGQGIIDLVNSYIQVGLAKGLVGLGLFVGVLVTAMFAAFRAMRIMQHHNAEASAYARGLFATMIGIMVVIATTSSNPPLPTYYWMIAALCVSVRRLAEEQKQTGFVGIGPSGEIAQSDTQSVSAHDPALSLRRAQEDADLIRQQDAEAAAHVARNQEKRKRVSQRNLPAHLRQYAKPNDPDADR